MEVLGTAEDLLNLQNEISEVLLVDITCHQVLLAQNNSRYGNITINLEDFFYYYSKYCEMPELDITTIDLVPPATDIFLFPLESWMIIMPSAILLAVFALKILRGLSRQRMKVLNSILIYSIIDENHPIEIRGQVNQLWLNLRVLKRLHI